MNEDELNELVGVDWKKKSFSIYCSTCRSKRVFPLTEICNPHLPCNRVLPNQTKLCEKIHITPKQMNRMRFFEYPKYDQYKVVLSNVARQLA